MLVSKLLRITLNNNVIRSTYMISCFLFFKELSHLMLYFISVLFFRNYHIWCDIFSDFLPFTNWRICQDFFSDYDFFRNYHTWCGFCLEVFLFSREIHIWCEFLTDLNVIFFGKWFRFGILILQTNFSVNLLCFKLSLSGTVFIKQFLYSSCKVAV